MGWAPPPTDEQLRGFLAKLWGWRATLTEIEQRLADSMLAAALGQAEAPCEDGDDKALPEVDGHCLQVMHWLSTPWGMTYWLRHSQ